MTLALLGVGDQALTLDEIRAALDRLASYVRQRELPHTPELDQLDDEAAVKRALDALADNDVVSRFSEGPEAIYRIGPDEQIEAAYYANTVVHFFVNPAIAELALLRAAEQDGERLEAFWDGVMRLRDLLKFEFFFSEKEIFRGEIAQELAHVDGGFERRLREGPDSIQELLRSFRPFHSHRVLRPFFEAYGLVADHLEQLDPDESIDDGRCVDRCMRLGKQYRLQRRIHSSVSVSQVLIRSALQLAENRGLLVAGAPELRERRREFAEEIRDVLRRIDAVDALAAARRARLID